MMNREVAERCVQLMEASAGSIGTVDITGGAPELLPQFRCVALPVGVEPSSCLPAAGALPPECDARRSGRCLAAS